MAGSLKAQLGEKIQKVADLQSQLQARKQVPVTIREALPEKKPKGKVAARLRCQLARGIQGAPQDGLSTILLGAYFLPFWLCLE
jgi:hypothetical protein